MDLTFILPLILLELIGNVVSGNIKVGAVKVDLGLKKGESSVQSGDESSQTTLSRLSGHSANGIDRSKTLSRNASGVAGNSASKNRISARNNKDNLGSNKDPSKCTIKSVKSDQISRCSLETKNSESGLSKSTLKKIADKNKASRTSERSLLLERHLEDALQLPAVFDGKSVGQMNTIEDLVQENDDILWPSDSTSQIGIDNGDCSHADSRVGNTRARSAKATSGTLRATSISNYNRAFDGGSVGEINVEHLIQENDNIIQPADSMSQIENQCDADSGLGNTRAESEISDNANNGNHDDKVIVIKFNLDDRTLLRYQLSSLFFLMFFLVTVIYHI